MKLHNCNNILLPHITFVHIHYLPAIIMEFPSYTKIKPKNEPHKIKKETTFIMEIIWSI